MKVLKIFGIIIFATLSIAGITQLNAPGGKNNLIVGIICGVITLFLLRSLFIAGPRKEKAKIELIQEAQNLHNEMISMIKNGTIEPIRNSRIILKKDELSYLEYEATLKIKKNQLLGTTGKSGGTTVRVTKGVYLRSGSSGSRKVYGDVTTKYNGLLSVTTQRIAFFNSEKGFEIPLNKLTNVISSYNNIVLQHGNKIYDMEISNADIVEQLIRKLINGMDGNYAVNPKECVFESADSTKNRMYDKGAPTI